MLHVGALGLRCDIREGRAYIVVKAQLKSTPLSVKTHRLLLWKAKYEYSKASVKQSLSTIAVEAGVTSGVY